MYLQHTASVPLLYSYWLSLFTSSAYSLVHNFKYFPFIFYFWCHMILICVTIVLYLCTKSDCNQNYLTVFAWSLTEMSSSSSRMSRWCCMTHKDHMLWIISLGTVNCSDFVNPQSSINTSWKALYESSALDTVSTLCDVIPWFLSCPFSDFQTYINLEWKIKKFRSKLGFIILSTSLDKNRLVLFLILSKFHTI